MEKLIKGMGGPRRTRRRRRNARKARLQFRKVKSAAPPALPSQHQTPDSKLKSRVKKVKIGPSRKSRRLRARRKRLQFRRTKQREDFLRRQEPPPSPPPLGFLDAVSSCLHGFLGHMITWILVYINTLT